MTHPIGSNRRNGNIHTLASLREDQRKREMSSSFYNAANTQQVTMAWQQGNASFDRALRKVEQILAKDIYIPGHSRTPDSQTIPAQTAETSIQVQRDLVQNEEALQTKPSVQEPSLPLTISTKTALPWGNIHTLASLREDQRKREMSSSSYSVPNAQQLRRAWQQENADLDQALRKVEKILAERKPNPAHSRIPDSQILQAEIVENALQFQRLLIEIEEARQIKASVQQPTVQQVSVREPRVQEPSLPLAISTKTALPQRKWLLFFISMFSIAFLTKIIARCKRGA